MRDGTRSKPTHLLKRAATLFGKRHEILALPGKSLKRNSARAGQSLVIVAMAFVGILAFVGLAVDTGIILLHRVWVGQAVDAASLAAGFELPNINAACTRAVEYLRSNGYEASSEFSYQIVFPKEPDAPGGDPGPFTIDSVADAIATPQDCATISVPASHQNVHYQVGVSANQTVPVIFMRLVGFDTVGVGAPGTAKRSALYDVALVLDKSGSMTQDTCGWHRPADQYACENRYAPCTIFYDDDFEAYADNLEMEADGWVRNSFANLVTTGGHSGSNEVEIAGTGELSKNVDTTGNQDVSVFFWARDINLGNSSELQVFWRPDPSVGWSLISEIQGNNELPSSWTHFSVLLPSEAADNPTLEIRFRTNASSSQRVAIDDVEVKSCPQKEGPWIYFKDGGSDGCPSYGPNWMTCDSDAPEMLLPGVSRFSDDPPMAQLMEQPMTDVLLATEKFIEVLDSRRLPLQPREDQIGLAVFGRQADKLQDLTLDYEAVREDLFTSIRGSGNTNIGGGMRVGLDILAAGRGNATHFIILITDGWPNRYDTPYVNPTNFAISCNNGGRPCRRTLEFIKAQTGEAQRQNVTIFAIGLGEFLDTETFDCFGVYTPCPMTGMDLLNNIADSTGGEAYLAPTSDDLEEIFEWIAQAIFVRLTK